MVCELYKFVTYTWLTNKNLWEVIPLADGADILPGSFFPVIITRSLVLISML